MVSIFVTGEYWIDITAPIPHLFSDDQPDKTVTKHAMKLSHVFELSRVPCIGECIKVTLDGQDLEIIVNNVTHVVGPGYDAIIKVYQ